MNQKILAGVVAAATLVAPAFAVAQSSSGNIVGEARTGDTVIVTGTDTGFRRELKIEKDGKFQIRRVPTGDYQVVRVHADGSMDPVQQLVVRPGGSARVMDAAPGADRDASTGS